MEGPRLGGDRLGDDLGVPHRVHVGVHPAGHQCLAQADGGLHRRDRPVAGDGVGREQDAGRLRDDHPLHDHGHADLSVVDVMLQPVGHRPLGEERRPAPADVPQVRRLTHDVQVRVMLTREGGRRQVLARRARPDGVGGALAQPDQLGRDRSSQVRGDGDPLDGLVDLSAERPESRPGRQAPGATDGRVDPRSTARPP